MTTPTHGLSTYLATAILLHNWKFTRDLRRGVIEALSSLSGAISMLPDLIPLSETLKGNWGHLYEFWHSFSLWSFVPQIGLHQVIDYLTHDQVTGGWLAWGYVLEALVSAFILWVFYSAYKRWIFVGVCVIFLASWVVSFII